MATSDDDIDRIRSLVRTSLGRKVASAIAIEPGLGSRRFFRVLLEGNGAPRSLVARIEREEDPGLRPEGIPPEPQLEPIRDWLERHGLPVFAQYAAEPGIQLIEDVGGESLETAARVQPLEEVHALYEQACALVPALQRVPANASIENFGRRLDARLFAYKAEQFIEWALPLTPGTNTEAQAQVVRDAFSYVAAECDRAPARLAHRDFKAANLHVVRDPSGAATLRLIDVQGAFLAPPEYDLVCLLRDSHVALDESFVQLTLRAVRAELPDAPDAETFRQRFNLLTLTRNGKDLARFLYAAKLRGDGRYVALLPRAVATLKAASALARDWDPSLTRLADVMASLPDSPCVP